MTRVTDWSAQRPWCDETGPAPDSGAPDPAAAAAAAADGVPYIATAAGWDDGCHAWITLPSGTRLGVDSYGLRHGGEALRGGSVRTFGCGR